MNENKKNECNIEPIPFLVYENSQARNERNIKRLWIALIITILISIASLFLTNLIWIRYINQYDFESYDYILDTGDGNGNNNFIGGDGNINGKNGN